MKVPPLINTQLAIQDKYELLDTLTDLDVLSKLSKSA